MEQNIKLLDRIIEQYHEGNINEEGFKNMVELVGSLTGEDQHADFIKARGCASRLQTLIGDGAVFSIRTTYEYKADQDVPAIAVHMTLAGCLDMMLAVGAPVPSNFKWQKGDYCEVEFYDQERNIVYFILLEEDEIEIVENIFDIKLEYTHDSDGKEII